MDQKAQNSLSVFDLLDYGLNIIPVKDKKPLIPWEHLQNTRVERDWVKEWNESDRKPDWGIVTGPISGILVLDIDGEEGRKSLEDLKVTLPFTWVTKTKRGWHYYFKWEEKLNACITTKAGILPGVDIRGKGGYVVSYPFIADHGPNERELAPVPEWLFKLLENKPIEEKTYKPGWILEALDSVDVGSRTQTFARVIGKLNRDNWANEDIFALLKPHAERLSFDLAKLWDQVQDMTKRYTDQVRQTDSKGKRAATLLTEKPATITWTVDQILPKQGIGLLAGWPGIGKSWLLLDIALCVSKGLPWLERFETKKGPVMYVDEDSSEDLVRYRLERLRNFRELPHDLDITFHIQEGTDILNDTTYEELKQKIEDCHPILVVMDTLGDIHSGNENTTQDMLKVFKKVKRLAKDYNTSFLFADHPRRNTGIDEGSEAKLRGAVTKAGKLDSAFFLSRIGDSILVEDIKTRWGKTIKSFEIKLIDVNTNSTAVRYLG